MIHCDSHYHRQRSFIANSSSSVTTKLSKLLISCLTAKILFWSIRNLGEILDKLKATDFYATSLSTYDCSTLYTALPHNLIEAAYSVTFDLLILEIMFLFFKNTAKNLKFMYIFDQFRKS